MTKRLAALVLVLAVAAPAMAAVLPGSPHDFLWREVDGGEIDYYVEAERGDVVQMQVMANIGGSGDGGSTAVTWDPIAMDVREKASNGWNWRVYYPTSSLTYSTGYFQAVYNGTGGTWPHYEGDLIDGVEITIDANAPYGLYKLGLVQAIFSGTANSATIPETDPFALQINVIPEPATLFVVGCGAIGLLRRRRRP